MTLLFVCCFLVIVYTGFTIQFSHIDDSSDGFLCITLFFFSFCLSLLLLFRLVLFVLTFNGSCDGIDVSAFFYVIHAGFKLYLGFSMGIDRLFDDRIFRYFHFLRAHSGLLLFFFHGNLLCVYCFRWSYCFCSHCMASFNCVRLSTLFRLIDDELCYGDRVMTIAFYFFLMCSHSTLDLSC